MSADSSHELKRVLRPVHLWAIAVGLVISGDYFGWNYGLAKAGPFGMILATLLVSVLYLCFIFSYTELATAIPHSGGPFAYAHRAFGRWGAYFAGAFTLLEFLFAPPAIAVAIGSYVHFRVPSLSIRSVALGAFAVFGAVNALGVSIAATFELIVTALATFELCLFFGLTAPHVQHKLLFTSPLLPFGWKGVFAAIPFAIWFYLGLEGAAMSAEEVVNPRKNIPRGFLAGMSTLLVLALGTLVCSSGILPASELGNTDSPLPLVLSRVLAPGHSMTHLMVYLGLLGLIASFHGIVMGASRQVFSLARDGLLPSVFARLFTKQQTPIPAIVLSVVVGALATLSGRANDLITVSVLGALGVYAISMLSMLVLRRRDPDLPRPFRAPYHPVLPGISLGLTCLCLAAVVVDAPRTTLVVTVLIGLGALLFGALHKPSTPK